MLRLHYLRTFFSVVPLVFTLYSYHEADKHSEPKQLTHEQLLAIGLQYDNGNGVEQDYKQAKHYYELAIEAGSVQAIHNLGFLYNSGHGVTKDRQTALSLWQQASDLGNVYSSYNLGNAHLCGNGRILSKEQALEYYYLSYQQGYKPALCQYAEVIADLNPLHSEQLREQIIPIANSGDIQCLAALSALLYEDFAQHQDSQLLLEWANKGAEKDIAHAHFVLAMVYDLGKKGVPANPEKAKTHYLASAKLGHKIAYSNLGYMYEEGKFGFPDYVSAKLYYEKAVAMNSHWGLNNLATFYREGLGKIVDYDKALALYTKSAELGNAYAHRNLGVMHKLGQGVPVDAYKAEEYFNKSIELGHNQPLLELGLLYLDKSLPLYNKQGAFDVLQQAIDAGVENAAETLAEQFSDEQRNWFVESQMSAQAAYDLASDYKDNGNTREACKWFLVAFDRRHDEAYLEVVPCVEQQQYADMPFTNRLQPVKEWAKFKQWDVNSLIGELFYFGIGLEQNLIKAAEYFHKADTETADRIARYKLGLLYLNGDGVTQDIKTAKQYFEISAQQGVSSSSFELAKMYRDGVGVAVNEKTARKYAQEAAKIIDSRQHTYLYATMLLEGYGGEQDYHQAIDWLDHAINLGHAEAACKLSQVLQTHYRNDEEKQRASQLAVNCM